MAKRVALSLRITLVAVLALAVVVPLVVIGIYVTTVTGENLAHEELHAFEARLMRVGHGLEHTLNDFLADLRALHGAPPLAGITRALNHDGTDPVTGMPAGDWQRRLAQSFAALAEAKSDYRLLRYIDESGWELVRVESLDGAVRYTPAKNLQARSERRFFVETMALNPGRIHVSELDLIEKPGGVAVAGGPEMQLAMPVFGPAGKRRGVLVATVSGNWVLDRLSEAEVTEGATLYLTDSRGDYLYHTDTSKRWGTQLGHGASLKSDRPRLVEAVQSVADTGHWHREDGAMLAFAKVRFDAESEARYWGLVGIPNLERLEGPMRSFMQVMAGVTALSLIVALGLGYRLAFVWVVHPIDALLGAVKRFGGGDLGTRAAVYADNEIGELARSFNDMAQFHASAIETERGHTEQLRLAASVFSTTRDGVTIADAEGNIVAVNAAFSEITGYQESEVLGRNPRLLKSHRHDDEFYRAMWKDLTHDGRWAGEIWNRRKSGEVYPEWLTITRVQNEQGVTTHYVAVFSDISVRKREQERLTHLAHYDLLTNLPNRLVLEDRVVHAIQRARRDEMLCALLFLDLDDFKPVNDAHGHLVGDQLLQAVAVRFAEALREEDTVARLGGDEFAVLLEQLYAREDAEAVAAKIKAALATPFAVNDSAVQIGVSIGVSFFPDDGADFTSLLQHADEAMYEAKRAKGNGRNIPLEAPRPI